MSDQSEDRAPLGARVIEVDAAAAAAPPQPLGPQIIPTDRTEPITPSEPALPAVARAAPRRRDRVMTFGVAGVALLLVGWLAVDAIGWIVAAFERSAALGVLAATAVAAGVAGGGAVIARELGSLLRLRNVEAIHRRLAGGRLLPVEGRKGIPERVAVLPRGRESRARVRNFQRQAKLHHATAQQIEILSRTVMKPLDRRAEAHVRTAVLRAFGITAISPTGLTDAVFFLACGIRMVRAIAAAYGHRPTAATT